MNNKTFVSRSAQSECHVLPEKTENSGKLEGWRGIPEEMVINGILAALMVLAYTALRRVYHCRRPPVENDWDIGWLPFIYGDREAAQMHNTFHINRDHSTAYLPPSLRDQSDQLWNRLDPTNKHPPSPAAVDSTDSLLVFTTRPEDRQRERHQRALDSVGRTPGRFWLWDYLCVSDDAVYQHRGHDAYQYLLLERYLVYHLVAVSLASLLVLLPVNVRGSYSVAQSQPAMDHFERTTINALPPGSGLLWAHVAMAIGYTAVAVVLMTHYSWQTFAVAEYDPRTVMVSNVPAGRPRNAARLKRYIEHCLPHSEVTRVTLTYDVTRLTPLNRELYCRQEALRYCTEYRRTRYRTVRVTPVVGGHLCCCCGCCSGYEVDGTEYYRSQVTETRAAIDRELRDVWSRPQHVVFIQFRTEAMASRFVAHFERTGERRDVRHNVRRIRRCVGEYCYCCCCCCPSENTGGPVQGDSDPFGYLGWQVRPAPIPEDLEWDDIVLTAGTYHATYWSLSLTVFCIFLLLTTPMVILYYAQRILYAIGVHLHPGANGESPLADEWQVGTLTATITKWVSVLSISLISLTLPRLLIVILMRIPAATKSEKNHKMMQTIFVFLFLNAYVLPSVGLISIDVLLQKLLESKPELLYQCMFPSESAAWFLKLVIAAGLFNTAFDLCRAPDALTYAFFAAVRPRTEAEYIKARLGCLPFEFSFAVNLAYNLLLYAIVITYCVACPLMAPVGLVALYLRYLLDRYQIYYLCALPERITGHIYRSAIFIVFFCNLLLLLQVASFVCFHRGGGDGNDHHETAPLLGWNPSTVILAAILVYFGFLCLFPWLYDRSAKSDAAAAVGGQSSSFSRRNKTATVNNINNNINNNSHKQNSAKSSKQKKPTTSVRPKPKLSAAAPLKLTSKGKFVSGNNKNSNNKKPNSKRRPMTNNIKSNNNNNKSNKSSRSAAKNGKSYK